MSDYIHDLIIPTYASEPLKYSKGDFLFHEGEADQYVYFLEEGVVKILKKKWVLWSARSNELIGVSSYFAEGSIYSFSARANSVCNAYRIHRDDFKGLLMKDASFSRSVMDMLCERIRLTNSRTKSLLQYPSKYRLIQEILRRSRELKTKQVPYSLEDLSGIVGVSVRLIRDMISDLEQRKLLKRTREILVLNDLKALELAAKIS